MKKTLTKNGAIITSDDFVITLTGDDADEQAEALMKILKVAKLRRIEDEDDEPEEEIDAPEEDEDDEGKSLTVALLEQLKIVSGQLKAMSLPAPRPDTDGLAVKAIREEDGGVVVGGYLLLWGDNSRKDMGGDYFVKGQTQLWLDKYPKAPTLFHHGLDKKVGLDVIGHRVKTQEDDTGVWVESWINKSNKYWHMVKPLLEAERLFYSPGSAKHLVQRTPTGELKSFPVIEDTLTPVPMQHRLLPVSQIKAAYAELDLDEPELKAAEEALPLDDSTPETGVSAGEIDALRAYVTAFETGLDIEIAN